MAELEALPPIALALGVTGGQIQGAEPTAGLKVWQGIPYAAAPVGPLRWQAPQPVPSWSGSRDATAPGASCMQLPGPPGGFYTREFGELSEDCLTLNVWSRAPHDQARLPVMYWVHGGGLTQGSGADYPGESLTNKGVVLVTVNYRLGPLGFFAHEDLSKENPHGVSGNQGIADQIAGLRWVRDNITKFGGDPNNVTIFGESAGSLSVSLLQASPQAAGLFHRVIGQSGAAFQPMTHLTQSSSFSPSAQALGAELANTLIEGVPGPSLSALRQVSAERVLALSQAASDYDRMPVVDGYLIPDQVQRIFAEGRQADVPVLVGSNADEGTALLPFIKPGFGEGAKGFSAYTAATLPEVAADIPLVYAYHSDAEAEASWANLFADVLFTYPQRQWARGMASVSSDAYLYFFTWQPPIPEQKRYGAFHAADIGYVFGTPSEFGAVPTQADFEFSDTLMEVWARFARTGNPNGPGIPQWSPHRADNEQYLELGKKIRARSHLRIPQMQLIRRAFAQRRGDNSTD